MRSAAPACHTRRSYRGGRQVGLVRVLARARPHGLRVQLVVQRAPVAQHRVHGGREEVPLPAGQHVFADVAAGGGPGLPQLFARRQPLTEVRPVGAGLPPLQRPVAGREHRLTFARGESRRRSDGHDGQQAAVVEHRSRARRNSARPAAERARRTFARENRERASVGGVCSRRPFVGRVVSRARRCVTVVSLSDAATGTADRGTVRVRVPVGTHELSSAAGSAVRYAAEQRAGGGNVIVREQSSTVFAGGPEQSATRDKLRSAGPPHERAHGPRDSEPGPARVAATVMRAAAVATVVEVTAATEVVVGCTRARARGGFRLFSAGPGDGGADLATYRYPTIIEHDARVTRDGRWSV